MIRIEIHRLAAIDGLNRADAVAARRAQSVALLCARLSALLQHKIDESSIARSATGKPYLPEFPQFAFNISHSRDVWVLVTSNRQQDLGVDVEALDRTVKFAATAVHAFHPNELTVWQQNNENQALWLRIWTVKEAILKAHGLGIRLALNSLNSKVHPLYDSGQTEHPQLGHFAYQSFELAGFMLSVAWRTGQGCGAFVQPKFEVIVNDFQS